MRTPRMVAMRCPHTGAPSRPHNINHAPRRHRRAHSLPSVAALLLAVWGAACARAGEAVGIEQAVIGAGNGLLPPTLYFTARNAGTVADTVVGVQVEGANAVKLVRHRDHLFDTSEPDTSADAAQVRLERVVLGAGMRFEFDPAGTYGIITPGTRAFVSGDSALVTVRFAHAPAAGMYARVVKYAQLDSALSPAVASGFPRWFVDLFDAKPAAPESVRDPGPTVAAGRDLFMANGCVSCHGLNGYGDGPVGRTLNPPPRDFRAAGAFRTGLDPGAIAQTIATGIPNGGSMPRYPHLSELQRRSLATYILSLARPSAIPPPLP